jgi:hypothetical protein
MGVVRMIDLEEDADELEYWEYDDTEDDDEPIFGRLAALAAEAREGRGQLPQGWQVEYLDAQTLVWTTPSGRRHASTIEGHMIPMPG